MQDEARKLQARPAFELQDRVQNVVQAVGLAGRPGTRAHHLVHVPEPRTDLVDVALGLGIVRVRADEDVVVLVVQRGRRQLGHLADDAGLVPGRNHDGQRLLRRRVQRAIVQPIVRAVDVTARQARRTQ